MSTQSALPRIIARFTPQAWIGDYAINVDAEGTVEFDVTDHILSLPREDVLALRDDMFESDDLRFAANAPAWAQAWSGPFYIEVEESVREFFDKAVPTEVYKACAHAIMQKHDVGYFDEHETKVRVMNDESGKGCLSDAAIGAWVTVEVWVDDFAARKAALVQGLQAAAQ